MKEISQSEVLKLDYSDSTEAISVAASEHMHLSEITSAGCSTCSSGGSSCTCSTCA